MSDRNNPFRPTAGMTPSLLIGRRRELEHFGDGLRNGPGAFERITYITGTRGMGKTATLNACRNVGDEMGWECVTKAAASGFVADIAEALEGRPRVSEVRIEPSFAGFSLGGVTTRRHVPQFEQLLLEHATNGRKLLIALDEVHDVDLDEMRQLAFAVQYVIGRGGDIALVMAGLPNMVVDVLYQKTLTFLLRSYQVRLGLLDEGAVAEFFADALVQSGMRVEEGVAREMARLSAGQPFLVQLVGYHVWQRAADAGGDLVADADVEAAFPVALAAYQSCVVAPALHDLGEDELRYLMAHASEFAGDPPVGFDEVGSRILLRLLDRGLLEEGEEHVIRFAVPYLHRHLEENERRLRTLLG